MWRIPTMFAFVIGALVGVYEAGTHHSLTAAFGVVGLLALAVFALVKDL